MKKTIVAVGLLALTTACGGDAGGGETKSEAPKANSAAAADHDEAVPTATAEENHGHEHDGTEAENHPH